MPLSPPENCQELRKFGLGCCSELLEADEALGAELEDKPSVSISFLSNSITFTVGNQTKSVIV